MLVPAPGARSLSGIRILVTRPREQAQVISDLLRELGAEVLMQPAIEISEPRDWSLVDRALESLPRYDWIVFSSANGVKALLDRLWQNHGDLRKLGGVRLAAIGSGTAEELCRYRLRADLIPSEYRAEALAATLLQTTGLQVVHPQEARPKRFLLVRASRGREVLADQLRAAGGDVDQVVAYTSTDVESPDPRIMTELVAGRIDWVTVTSSAIARSLARLFGENLRKAKLASISPITSAVLKEVGFEPAAEAREYTMDGVVRAIASTFQ
ncbi:MAG: uroporphyrinogen-III synthase [Thermoguttaceae bacterium]